MDTNKANISLWLDKYVNSDAFSKMLDDAIRCVENPGQRAKLLMDLMDYVVPKIKTMDAPVQGEDKTIHITYVVDNTKKE